MIPVMFYNGGVGGGRRHTGLSRGGIGPAWTITFASQIFLCLPWHRFQVTLKDDRKSVLPGHTAKPDHLVLLDSGEKGSLVSYEIGDRAMHWFLSSVRDPKQPLQACVLGFLDSPLCIAKQSPPLTSVHQDWN